MSINRRKHLKIVVYSSNKILLSYRRRGITDNLQQYECMLHERKLETKVNILYNSIFKES